MKSLFLLLIFLVGCSNSSKKVVTSKDTVMLSKEPSVGSLKLRPSRELVLENGLKIIFIREHSLPRVSLSLLVRAGLREEPEDKGGVNALTAQLLEAGTVAKSAGVLADEFAAMGTDLSISPGVDATVLSSDALSMSAENLLAVFYEVVTTPAFKENEIQRIKSLFVSSIKKRLDSPSEVVDEAFQQSLFEGHSYSRSAVGDEASLKKIRKQDIVKHYLNWYRPNNSSLAVVGAFGEAFEKKVIETFKAWPQRNLKKVNVIDLADFSDFQMKLVTKPGLAQTQIRIGQRGVPRQNADFLKLRLANEILGGGFASRLNQKIRDDLGLTYSIGSYIDARLERGSFGISTFTKNESVQKTVEETLKVFEEFVVQGVNENELRAAKNLLIGQFPRSIETADRLAGTYLMLDFYGVTRSYLTEYNRNVEKISLNEVNEVIKKYYSPKNLRAVIYGDAKAISDQLKVYSPAINKVQ